ncbi:pilus assembly protein [Xylophilus rhododendri]|nr:pilus assembly protein [Xylophilus rhododendri]
MVVMLLLLCTLAVCGAARVMLLNESVVGNNADRARAFAAAEALIQDAETDIRGSWPDGSPCRPEAPARGCRDADALVAFPADATEYLALSEELDRDPALPCRLGICRQLKPQDLARLAEDPARLKELTDTARSPPAFATYGQFTRAGQPPPQIQGNPYLAHEAWYWVEVLDYPAPVDADEKVLRLAADPVQPYLYRITALVNGRREGTRVLLQELFVPSPLMTQP